ncbi:response regulator [Paraburkholderia phymatum]|uniref:Response regulator n=1 Tax=Paraburkholderia phymatum TaxID=148447 RepID=A0ACC6UB62_9BURK
MNATREFRIAIADDHPVIRHAVINALSSLPGFTVDAAVKSGVELLETLSSGQWDLIVTDFSMDSTQRDTDGLALIARLRRQCPRIPIVVFTMLNNDDTLIRLSRSGVSGIVDKTEGIAEFQAAVHEVASHRRPYFSQKIRARLLRRVGGDALQSGKPMLTKKELEVIRHFAAGASLTDIARQVNRSISTVATQKSTAMKKLRLETNADLVKYAHEHGLA